MTNLNNDIQYLIIGEILRPHGIKGELRVRIMTDYPERLIAKEVKTIYLGTGVSDKRAKAFTVKSARLHKDYLLITLKEINSRNDADTLRGLYAMVDFDNAVPLYEDEYYVHEIIGLKVVTTEGIELGTLHSVVETGANDVYVVRGGEQGELLLPAHDETIVEINFDTETITMNLPEGLLPDELVSDEN